MANAIANISASDNMACKSLVPQRAIYLSYAYLTSVRCPQIFLLTVSRFEIKIFGLFLHCPSHSAVELPTDRLEVRKVLACV